jgi:Fe2+ transport system protein FeoA
MQTTLFNLITQNFNGLFEVICVTGGKRAKKKLLEMGIYRGIKGHVIQRCPIILCIDDTRLALGCGLADKIVVCLDK